MKPNKKNCRFSQSPQTNYRARKVHVASVTTRSIRIMYRKTETYMGCLPAYISRIPVSSCSNNNSLIHNRVPLVANNTGLKHKTIAKVADSQNDAVTLPDATDATLLYLATLATAPSRYTSIPVFATFCAARRNDSERSRNVVGGMRYLISQSILGVFMSEAIKPQYATRLCLIGFSGGSDLLPAPTARTLPWTREGRSALLKP